MLNKAWWEGILRVVGGNLKRLYWKRRFYDHLIPDRLKNTDEIEREMFIEHFEEIHRDQKKLLSEMKIGIHL